jgi:hypothetical protein
MLPASTIRFHCRWYSPHCHQSSTAQQLPSPTNTHGHTHPLLPRPQLDYDTIAAADKFGNVFVVRLPAEVSAQVEDDPTGGKLAAAMGKLNGAPHKLTNLCQFHVGDTVTSLQLAAMVEGGEQVILYTTIMGSVGVLVRGPPAWPSV